MANIIRDAINMVAEGKNPAEVAAHLVAESTMSTLDMVINDTVDALSTDGKVQVSLGSEKWVYVDILGTIFKASPKDTSFTAIGSTRDVNNVIQRDLETLLTTAEDVADVQVDDSVQTLKSMANSGAKDSLAALCKKRCVDKEAVYDAFKTVFGFSRKDTEAAFSPEDWESFE